MRVYIRVRMVSLIREAPAYSKFAYFGNITHPGVCARVCATHAHLLFRLVSYNIANSLRARIALSMLGTRRAATMRTQEPNHTVRPLNITYYYYVLYYVHTKPRNTLANMSLI